MGRIAEALKKAQRERQQRRAGAVALAPDPTTTRQPDGPPPQPVEPVAGADPPQAPPQVSDQPPVVIAPQPEHEVPQGVGNLLDPALVAYHDKASPITEQYRSVRTRLLSQNPANQRRTLAITSSGIGEGKTVTTVNLAFVMAELRHLNVLVLDGDFRRHSLATMLNISPAPGLAEMIQGQVELQDVLKPTCLPNLHVIASGSTGQSNAAELLSSERAAELFKQFRQQYHYVLVDTPPTNTFTDAGIIGQLCDAVLMVVRMNRTPEPFAKRAIRILQANNIDIAGCILTGHVEQTSRYPYYGYGYGYGYYDKY